MNKTTCTKAILQGNSRWVIKILAIRQGVNILKPSRQLRGVMKPRKNTGFLFPYPVP